MAHIRQQQWQLNWLVIGCCLVGRLDRPIVASVIGVGSVVAESELVSMVMMMRTNKKLVACL